MRDRLNTRLAELKAEFEKGKATLEELEAKAQSVRSMMLRISGAIQVLEEELGREGEGASPANGAPDAAQPANGAGPANPTLRVPS